MNIWKHADNISVFIGQWSFFNNDKEWLRTNRETSEAITTNMRMLTFFTIHLVIFA